MSQQFDVIALAFEFTTQGGAMTTVTQEVQTLLAEPVDAAN